MGDHEATTTTSSTQAAFPWRAAWRTVVQVGIPAFIGLLWILPLIIQEVLDGLGEQLPPAVYGFLAAAAATITALAGVLARISALPGVIAWTRKYLPFLAPEPKDTTDV
jgi:hypothetical protein